MKALEQLLSRRWILKSKDKELYYQVKDELGSIRPFLAEKLGYQVIVNPYLIKAEKMPAAAEEWMGISEFTEKIHYVFLCLILMFLEDKEAEEQFVLSQLTEYVQTQWKEEQIDWTVYSYRRHFIRVIKFCIENGMLEVNDGSEDSFAKDQSGEVLYKNTGISRYFTRTFTQDIMTYAGLSDFEREEWIDVEQNRGIVRRQRVYRKLTMSMGMYRDGDADEDFAYVRNYRNMIGGELEEMFDCELQVHKTSAFLVLGESCSMGRTFPEETTRSDIVLLCSNILWEKLEAGELKAPDDEQIVVAEEVFRRIIEECKERYGKGFIKTYRTMTTGEFYRAVKQYMLQMALICQRGRDILICTALYKIKGSYPEDFKYEQ